MNPVMSDLGIWVAEREAQANREVLRQHRIVREIGSHSRGEGLAHRLGHSLRQFVNPRGYAMSQLRPRPVVEAPPSPILPMATAPITRLEVGERDGAECHPPKAA